MVYIFEEGGATVIQLPLVKVEEGEVKEEQIELVVDREGRVAKGPYATVQEAFQRALESLSAALHQTESFLDQLEYRLEMEEAVRPGEIYTASYLAHHLYYTASQLYNFGRELGRRGLVGHRAQNYSRALYRKALVLRRYARDLRLLYATMVQVSLNASMKKLTWLGTVALPALLITSIYGMNLKWLPLADSPPAVFAILAASTLAFAYLLNKI